MPLLATWSPEDALLGAAVSIGLAAALPTALVVDLDPSGSALPGERTLADLVLESPRRADLEPARRGTATLPNGGIGQEAAAEVVEALATGWPAVVLCLPPRPSPEAFRGVVPVVALRPGMEESDRPALYQAGPWRVEPPGHGLILPRPRAATIRSLLAGIRPVPDRWMRTLAKAWRLRWG